MAGADLLETPGEGERSGEARFFIYIQARTRMGEWHECQRRLVLSSLDNHTWVKSSHFTLQSGVEVHPKGLGLVVCLLWILFAVRRRDIPNLKMLLRRKERPRLASADFK
jgi:hypothetical protein